MTETSNIQNGEGQGEGRELQRTPREDRVTGGNPQSGRGAVTLQSLRPSGRDDQGRPGLSEWIQGSQTDVQGLQTEQQVSTQLQANHRRLYRNFRNLLRHK